MTNDNAPEMRHIDFYAKDNAPANADDAEGHARMDDAPEFQGIWDEAPANADDAEGHARLDNEPDFYARDKAPANAPDLRQLDKASIADDDAEGHVKHDGDDNPDFVAKS